MIEYMPYVLAILAFVFIGVHHFWLQPKQLDAQIKREQELVKLVKSLQNKIQARDLQGYMALEASQVELERRAAAPPRTEFIAGDDEKMAAAYANSPEALRRDLTNGEYL